MAISDYGGVTQIEQSPILHKIIYLYLDLCETASVLKLQLNTGQKSELKITINKFEKEFNGLYYLARIKEGFDKDLEIKIKKWQCATFTNGKPLKYYNDSLLLFDDLSKYMRESSLIKV